ncbi:hypothetical protein SHEWT2_04090 [Shewanella hafniensis]|nr:hypothetical protein SHEWT2_04090 [Shewanella hafniensis]
MLSSDLEIGFFLALLLVGIFYTHSSSIKFFNILYRIFPLMLICYILPAIFSSLNIIDASNSQLTEIAKTHFMPSCLFLLILSTDFFALTLVGRKPVFFKIVVTLCLNIKLHLLRLLLVPYLG